MSESEKAMDCLPVVTIVDQYTVRLRLRRDVVAGISQEPQSAFKDEEYQFDSCFSESQSQADVFEDTKMLM